MAPFESRETLELTAYDGPVSAPRRHSRLRRGCDGATSARPGSVQLTGAASRLLPERPAKLLPRLPGKHTFMTKEAHLSRGVHKVYSRKKGCGAESDTLEASRSVTALLLPAAQPVRSTVVLFS